MSLLLLLILPVLIGLIGFLKSGGEVNLKEFLVLEAVVVIVISVGFAIGAYNRTADKEIWSGTIAEKHTGLTTCSCHCVQVCSGSGKSRSCHQVCQICPQRFWKATTTNDESAYYRLGMCDVPGQSTPKRYDAIVIGEPTAIEHHYANYVKGSENTIFKRSGTDLEKFKDQIPAYPRVYDYYRADRFISEPNDDHQKHWNEQLAIENGKIGAAKQVSMIVIVTKASDPSYLEALRQSWIGAKKNDFVVVVGAPEYPKIAWAGVLSWSNAEEAKIAVRDRIMGLSEFDGEVVIKIISEEVNAKYVRREMKDFEYLKASIEPAALVKKILFFLGIAISVGLTIWFWREDPLN